MIERTPANFSRNLHLCALCVSALSSPTLSAQPLSFQPLTHYPSQRPLLNPFAINPLRTLFISTGMGTPLPDLPTFEPSIVPTCFRAIPSLFILLRTLLHFFAFPKNSTLLFSSDSALFAKKRGEGASQRSASSCGVLGNSAWSKWATLSAPRHASHESPVTSHQARTRVSQNQPKMEGLSLRVSAFDLESLAESVELELAMVFVMGRLVRPYHGFR